MGASIAGIFIKLEPKSIDIDKVVQDLFGKIESKSKLYSSEYSSKNNKTLSIVSLDNGIVIVEPSFAEELLVKGGEKLKMLVDYFNLPDFMLAFMNFDSANGYGFRYIEKNRTVRLKHVNSSLVSTEYGEPMDVEMKYLNAFYFKDKEQDNMVIYNFTGNREEDGLYSYMHSQLTDDVMRAKIGISIHDAEFDDNTIYYLLENEFIKDFKNTNKKLAEPYLKQTKGGLLTIIIKHFFRILTRYF